MNKDIKVKDNKQKFKGACPARTEAESEPQLKITTSRPACSNTFVGSSALQLVSVNNVWVCVDQYNDPDYDTISVTKNWSIQKLTGRMVANSKFSKWRFWKNKGYCCIKVNIDFSQVKSI